MDPTPQSVAFVRVVRWNCFKGWERTRQHTDCNDMDKNIGSNESWYLHLYSLRPVQCRFRRRGLQTITAKCSLMNRDVLVAVLLVETILSAMLKHVSPWGLSFLLMLFPALCQKTKHLHTRCSQWHGDGNNQARGWIDEWTWLWFVKRPSSCIDTFDMWLTDWKWQGRQCSTER